MFASKRRLAQRGQSLIEVTFAAAVVGLVLVAVLSTVIASFRQTRLALEQTQSTQYGQAALEWMRSQRDQLGWGNFYAEVADRGPLQTYCWSTLPATFDAWLQQASGACDPSEFIPNTEVTRQVEVEVIAGPPENIVVRLIITRPGDNGPIVNQLETNLADWE